jgi:hypothetical protein
MCAMWDLSKVFDYKGRLKTSAVSRLNSFKPVFTLDNLKKNIFHNSPLLEPVQNDPNQEHHHRRARSNCCNMHSYRTAICGNSFN